MPKVYNVDEPDEEFQYKVGKWIHLCFAHAPEKLRERFSVGLVLCTMWFIWIMFLLEQILPKEFVAEYFILDIYDPTIPRMFFTNYIHQLQSLDHILSTTILFGITCILIIVFNMRRKPVFAATFLTFILLLPFHISAISIIILKHTGITATIGFSGISCAFLGYLSYTMIATMWDFTITYNYGKYEAVPWVLVNKFLIATIVIVVLPILYYVLETFLLNGFANAAAHVSGFIAGLILPQLIGIFIGTNRWKWKIYSLIMLLTWLFSPALYIVVINYL